MRALLNRAGVQDCGKLYSSHIDETDIALGGIKRIRHAIEDIAGRGSLKYLFLLPSAVPTVIGTDLPAICEELQPDYPKMRLIPFPIESFDTSGHRGVEAALLHLVKELPKDVSITEKPTFNLIGSCADMFRFQADAHEIQRVLEGAYGMKPLCILSSDTSVSDIEGIGGAHINLVIRREGLAAAEYLRQRFGTPFIQNRPYGLEGTHKWLEDIGEILGRKPNQSFIQMQCREVLSAMDTAKPSLQHLIRNHPKIVTLSIGAHADWSYVKI